MAPRTESPRLAAIDPEAVARETVASLRALIERVALPLQPAYRVTIAPMPRPEGVPPADDLETNLGQTVRQLATFAQRGDAGDWRERHHLHPGDVEAAIAEVLRAVPEPPPALSLVVDAARARIAWETDQPMDARELAALAGVSPTQIRLLARNGELPGGLPMSARAAGAWLTTRWQVKGVLNIHSAYVPQLGGRRGR